MDFNKKLIFENGETYPGFGFGSDSEKVCEIVFNTSMVGYQEIISDPSYTDQGVVMTYPLIGNYGIANDDYESEVFGISALIVREYNNKPSNFRSIDTLDDIMKNHDISGISGVDTRKLTRSIRDFGSRKGLICGIDKSDEECMRILAGYSFPHDAVMRAGAKEISVFNTSAGKFRVAAIDCGMKRNIVRSFNRALCDVVVFPHTAKAEEVMACNPDGIFISNGPGDPTDVPSVISLIKEVKGKKPVFGICLGHQLISLAYGAKTYKLKFGHRGGNHPVKNLDSGKIEITSQNHSYAVDTCSVEGTDLHITHINLLDNTVEGVSCGKDYIFSVQYHPESAPGPEDSTYLFDRFFKMMEEFRNAQEN